MSLTTILANNDNQVPTHAWPGGYRLIYLMRDQGTLCAECVEENRGLILENEALGVADGDPQWMVVDSFVHWEGPSIFCDHCNDELESEYGDPEEEGV